jgi:hypothetical protein
MGDGERQPRGQMGWIYIDCALKGLDSLHLALIFLLFYAQVKPS